MSKEIHDLAMQIYKDYIDDAWKGEHHQQAGALDGLGYNDLILGWESYTSPETARRRQRIFDALRDKPYFADLVRIGLVGHKRVKVEHDRVYEMPEPYFSIDDNGIISWGLKSDTKGLDFFFAWKGFNRYFLSIVDGGKVLFTVGSDKRDNKTSLEALGLTDDDYRFKVGYEKSNGQEVGRGIPKCTKSFDYAIIDNRWQQLDYSQTGYDWDGEWGESNKVAEQPKPKPVDHSAMEKPKYEGTVTISEDTKDWVASRAKRYGSGSTGKHWKELEKVLGK